MGFIELVITVCALSNPTHCEDRHLQFTEVASLFRCTMSAPPHIAQWIGEHPKWRAVRWKCAYPGKTA
jgi:hypothetical protein